MASKLIQDGNVIELDADKWDVRIWMEEVGGSQVIIVRRENIDWLIGQLQDSKKL
jgi:hypothetical protein